MDSSTCRTPQFLTPGKAKQIENVTNGKQVETLDAVEETSYLDRIEVHGSDPIALFNEWRSTALARGTLMVNTMVLATVNSALEVSARTVVLRRLDGDNFVFMTDSRSRKANDLAEHPSASLVFVWHYRLGARVVNRQVRAAGAVTRLEPEEFRDLYDREPLYCRVRSHICHQGAVVDWEKHAARHDQLMEDHRAGRAHLDQMPDHVVAFRLQPDWVEFYTALDDCIGDRVLFSRASDGWSHKHLSA